MYLKSTRVYVEGIYFSCESSLSVKEQYATLKILKFSLIVRLRGHKQNK